MKKLNIREILEFVCRIYVFAFLCVYGIGKIMGGQFYTPNRIPEEVALTPLGQAENFDLAWTFMGRSFGYILFIGISQIIGACLLLFNRTKLIGVAILIPILLNIIVFDIFFLDSYGALSNAIIYFCMLLLVLFFNKDKIVTVFKTLIAFSSREKQPLKYRLYKTGFALVIFVFVFLLDQVLVNLFGHGKG